MNKKINNVKKSKNGNFIMDCHHLTSFFFSKCGPEVNLCAGSVITRAFFRQNTRYNSRFPPNAKLKYDFGMTQMGVIVHGKQSFDLYSFVGQNPNIKYKIFKVK